MSVLGQALVALVALLHAYFLVLEMFLWDRPAGLRAFGMTPEKAVDIALSQIKADFAKYPEPSE